MYDIDSVAALLGRSRSRIYRWLKSCGLKTTVITLDRRRAYISDEDMLVLLAHFNRNHPGHEIKEEICEKYRKEPPVIKEVSEEMLDHYNIAENDLNSLQDVALFFGVSPRTVRRWIQERNIETVRMKRAGRMLLYIKYDDILALTRFYGRKVPDPKVHTIAEEIQEIKHQLKTLRADVEGIKHDLTIYVRRSIYVGGNPRSRRTQNS